MEQGTLSNVYKLIIILKYMNRTFIFLVLGIFLFSFVSADMGTFQQNACIDIHIISNSTAVTLSALNYPNTTEIVSSKIMTKNNSMFNYTTCKTDTNGVYSVYYNSSVDNVYTDTFTITPSGNILTSAEVDIFKIGIYVLLGLTIFFFIISYIMQMPQIKVLFMGLSSITLVFLIGIMNSNITTFLYKFTNYISTYNAYYIFILILSSAAVLALMVWFIYYTFTTFNKTRGTFPED